MPFCKKKYTNRKIAIRQLLCKKISQFVYGSNRNITMYNWFTLTDLADELLEDPYNLTRLGTLRKIQIIRYNVLF